MGLLESKPVSSAKLLESSQPSGILQYHLYV